MANLNYHYDSSTDILTIEGIMYSGELFRLWAKDMPIGTVHQVVERKDGTIALMIVEEGKNG